VATSHTQYNTTNQGRSEEIGTLDAPETVTVEAGKTATISVVVAADPTWDNTFIDGRILLETEEDYGLVFPFMGYLGDWSIYSEEDTIDGDAKFPDNNNIIDLPWWNEDYTWTGSTGLYWPQQPGEYVALGLMNEGFEPTALAISAGSPYSVMNSSLQVLLTMLRMLKS